MQRGSGLLLLALLLCPCLSMVYGAGSLAFQLPEDEELQAEAVVERADTVSLSPEAEDFYEKVNKRAEKNNFNKAVYGLVFKPPKTEVEVSDRAVVDEASLYSQFEGKRIASIEIDKNNVFGDTDNKVEKSLNALHKTSRNRTIRRDLLFHVGDAVDPKLLVQNKQILRSRSHLYDAQIFVLPVEDDSTAVDIKVITHDSWSIGGSAKFAGFTGRSAASIYDANIFGTGNRLKYTINFDWKGGGYKGSQLEYNVPNFLGTFFTANMTAGRSFNDMRHTISINKRLISNSDYELGFDFINASTTYWLLYVNNHLWSQTANIAYNSVDIWGGKSFYIPSIESSLYVMARGYMIDYGKRELANKEMYTGVSKNIVGKGINPRLHDSRMILGSLGFYRERFLTTKLIHGYGFQEYIPVGYRAEVSAGWMNEEFRKGMYAGMLLRAGKFTSVGYFAGSAELGGYYSFEESKFFREAMNIKFDYFTNLLPIIGPDTYLRQFLSLDYVHGFHREEGVDEWIRLTSESGPRSIKVYSKGRQRATMSTETVVFTPWKPLGFRIAMYGFFDAALIGTERNMFRNDFYSSLGVGIRLKNERLIFSTVQLSFCVAFGKNGLVKNDWVRLATESRMQSQRYIPQKPHTVTYK